MNIKRGGGIILQYVIVATALAALVFLLWFPQVEGRNVDATWFQIYFQDPFLAVAYFAAIWLFVGLYQTYKLAGYLGWGRNYEGEVVRALSTIRYCALTLVAFLLAGELYLFIFQRGKDDIAGGVATGLFLIVVFGTAAAIATWGKKKLRSDTTGF